MTHGDALDEVVRLRAAIEEKDRALELCCQIISGKTEKSLDNWYLVEKARRGGRVLIRADARTQTGGKRDE